MTEAEKVAYELSEDEGKVVTHGLHARSCSICGEKIKHGQQYVRVYTRPKHSKSSKRKAVMHEYHYQRTRQERDSKPDKGRKGADMAGDPIRTKLIHYLRQHPGIEVFADEMAEALNESRKRVMNGMGNILNEKQDKGKFAAEFAGHVQKLEAGVWRYQPPGKQPIKQQPSEQGSGKRLFTEVGATKDGSLVLECEDGKLFMANEM